MFAASTPYNPLSSEPTWETSEVLEASGHAAPLSPLRNRDLKAMMELFQLNEIEAIEQDILQNLVLRYPEPCWEDHVFDFLKEFL
jgi:hypothetical protein